MEYKNRHTYILAIVVIIIFGFTLFQSHKNNLTSTSFATSSAAIAGSCGPYQKGEVMVNGQKISVDISDTNCKQTLGLSGRTSLPIGTGMIFIFPQDSNYIFWMKDMNFPLDIVWVSADFHIVGIEKNVSPDTYDTKNPSQSETFGQNYLAQYVIELPAGYADKNSLQVGNKISFSENAL